MTNLLSQDSAPAPIQIPHTPEVVSEVGPAPVEPPRRRWGWKIFGIMSILVVVALGIGAFFVGRFAWETKVIAEDTKAALQERDFSRASKDFAELHARVVYVDQTVKSLSALRSVPGLGYGIRMAEESIRATLAILEPARELVDIAVSIQEGVESISAPWTDLVGISATDRYAALSPAQKRGVLQKLAEALPKIKIIREKISVSLELWKRVDSTIFPESFAKPLQEFLQQSPVLLHAMDQSIALLEVGIPLAGYPTEQRYLFLLQNRDEIRPTGGFIGNVGTATLDAGELKEFDVQDVYHVDGPVHGTWKEPLPAAMAKGLGVPAWYFRDANWSPDFPTSAQTLLDFYTRELAQSGRALAKPVTGVIAYQPDVFESLLRLTGPIEIRGKQFTAENVYDRLQYEVEVGFVSEGIPLKDRKGLVEDLGKALLAKVTELPASQWPSVLNILVQALDDRQIQMYATKPEVLRVLDARGWTGRAKPTQGDFLWVVDGNLAAFKTDGVMKKRVTYHVEATDPTRPTAIVTLEYHNPIQKPDWRYTNYRSYTRVYVPEGAALISSEGTTGPVDVTKELGKTVFGTFWTVPPQQIKTMTFRYQLPSSVIADLSTKQYRLDWMKQVGNESMDRTVRVQFPTVVQTAEPSEPEMRWGDAVYEITLDGTRDAQMRVTF